MNLKNYLGFQMNFSLFEFLIILLSIIVLFVFCFIFLPYSVYYMLSIIIETIKTDKSIFKIIMSILFVIFLSLSFFGNLLLIKRQIYNLRELIQPGKVIDEKLKKTMMMRNIKSNKNLKK